MENLTVFRKSLVDFQSNTQGVGNICVISNLALNNFIDVALLWGISLWCILQTSWYCIKHDNLSMPQIGRLKGFQVLCSYNDYMTVCVDRFHVWRSHPWVILRVFDLGTLVKVGIHTSRTGKFIIIFAFPKNCKGFVQFLGFKNLNSMDCCN